MPDWPWESEYARQVDALYLWVGVWVALAVGVVVRVWLT